MNRTDIDVIPDYFRGYVNLIPAETNLLDALLEYGEVYIQKELDQYKALGDRVYMPGKWTIKEILIHLMDTERIFAYRALRFARGDKTEIPGFEHNDYVVRSGANKRSLDEIHQEWKAVRKSTNLLFSSFSDEALKRVGIASGKEVSVLALGFMITGHLIHHQRIVEAQYYPLLSQD